MFIMNKNEFENKWIKAFASNVSKEDLDLRVYDEGNYLWHIFSWELVKCKEGDEARKAFDELVNKKALIIQMWYDEETKPLSPDSKSSDFDNMQEVFIVDNEFEWTYVVTHEINCGPYFCIK